MYLFVQSGLLNTVISQASQLYIILDCLNSCHRINKHVILCFLQNTERYPPPGSCEPVSIPSGGYISIFSLGQHNFFKIKHRIAQFSYLKVPQPNLELYRKKINYRGAVVWNSIQPSTRNAESVKAVKAGYCRSVLGQLGLDFNHCIYVIYVYM